MQCRLNDKRMNSLLLRRSPRSKERSRAYTLETESPSSCKLKINYEKMWELCSHFTPNERINHQDFMKKYPSIFISSGQKPSTPSASRQRPRRPHTCIGIGSSRGVPVSDMRALLQKIHGSNMDKGEKVHIALSARLQMALAIIKKLPIQRNHHEIKELAEQLMELVPSIPRDQAITKEDFYVGLAQRAILEHIPSFAYSLPAKGGLYIILKGSIQKLDINETTGQEFTTLLLPGETFGAVGEKELTQQLAKRVYPIYTSAEATMLLRINDADYYRVAKNCKKLYQEEKQKLICSSELLFAVSPSILNRLADTCTMEEVQKDAVLMTQGQQIDRVYFIKEGTCEATVKVPGARKSTEIIVGELTSGDCIGEVVLLRQTEIQPYTITAVTNTKLGSVLLSTIKATELQKHILPDRKLALPLVTDEKIRESYVRGTMDQQWAMIKKYVMDEVTKERGIEHGSKKWQHSYV